MTAPVAGNDKGESMTRAPSSFREIVLTVLVPLKVMVPDPFLMSSPEPEISPAKVPSVD